jgi:hypothetical protein
MTEEVKEHLQTSIFVNFLHASWYPPCPYSAVTQKYMVLVGFPKPILPLAMCSRLFMICRDEMCNHNDRCQPTFELSAPSPYMMQSQYTIINWQ